MGVVRCERCDQMIDLDWNVDDVICKVDYPFIDCSEFGWVCINCLTDEESEKLEEAEA